MVLCALRISVIIANFRVLVFLPFEFYFWGTEFRQHTFVALVFVNDWLCFFSFFTADYCSWRLSHVQCSLHVKHNIRNLSKQSWITAIFSACVMETNVFWGKVQIHLLLYFIFWLLQADPVTHSLLLSSPLWFPPMATSSVLILWLTCFNCETWLVCNIWAKRWATNS